MDERRSCKFGFSRSMARKAPSFPFPSERVSGQISHDATTPARANTCWRLHSGASITQPKCIPERATALACFPGLSPASRFVPDTIDGLPVTQTGEQVFSGCTNLYMRSHGPMQAITRLNRVVENRFLTGG